jgi:hypothetical protein
MNFKGKLQVNTLQGWMDRIRNLQTTFTKLSVIHTYRENNKEVDLLSKVALKKKVGSISFNIWMDGHEGHTQVLNLSYLHQNRDSPIREEAEERQAILHPTLSPVYDLKNHDSFQPFQLTAHAYSGAV